MVGVPLVDRMSEWFARGGISELILAVNHLSDKLRIEVARRKLDTKTVLSVEETPLGTGGPISLARPMLSGEDPLIVANGDVISDINLRGLITAHLESKAKATIALVSVKDPRPFGLATLGADDRIVGFEEKSQNRRGSGWINAGVYALDAEVLAMIPQGRPVSLEREIFPVLAGQGEMKGWKHTGFWYDIGKVPDYITANRELVNRPEFRKGERRDQRMKMIEVVEPSYVGKEAILEGGAKIGPRSILSERVTLRKGAVVRETIVFEQTTLNENCVVEDSIVGEAVTIGKDSKVGKGSIIAGQVVVPEGAFIKPGSVILN